MQKLLLTFILATFVAAAAWGQNGFQIDSIAFAHDSTAMGANVGYNIDDGWSGPIPLQFDFCFFGTMYDTVWVGSNGLLTFTPQVAGGFCQWNVNLPFPNSPNFPPDKTIAFPWQDFFPTVKKVDIKGSIPYRRFILSFLDSDCWGCPSATFTAQVILYETTNIIEIHITDKPLCNWNNGAAIEGILIDDSTAFVVPGRNFPTQWSAHHDAYRFSPIGPCQGLAYFDTLAGKVFWDRNANCSWDSTDLPMPHRPIIANGSRNLTWSDSAGNFMMHLPPGNYTVSELIPATNYFSSCVPGQSHSVTLNGPSVTGLEFPDTMRIPCANHAVGISSTGLHRCDTANRIAVYYANYGSLTDTNVVINIHLHDSVIPYSSTLPLTQMGPHHYQAQLGDLLPEQRGVLTLACYVGCVSPDTVLCFFAQITSAATLPCDTADDRDHDCLMIDSIFPGNSKRVAAQDFAHLSYVSIDYIDDLDTLTYRIDFQNKNTAPVTDVWIRDTIYGNYLDPTTVKMVGASHPFEWVRIEDTLFMHFYDIYLLDSATYEPLSRGFVKFRIRQHPGNLPDTYIYNQAEISFNHLPLIYTNATTNIIPLPANAPSTQSMNVQIFPNPSHHSLHLRYQGPTATWTISDITGRTLTTETIDSGESTLNIANLPAGLYFFRITAEGMTTATGKWIKE